ncbi:GNAT family N-acetyltransferase [Kineosporia babensis]|uniref:GNAT family N-acetyltransferase n=1 Tax=Kineosporia babensis TaxID=499548 RepID=A0A9X1NB96_9ACTN|nr:GNAT family N-acetyltransferase [Kineosporia babensis]MCD5310621.1 GNAT family N-acetyltransferase [Kineosporia babensis]
MSELFGRPHAEVVLDPAGPVLAFAEGIHYQVKVPAGKADPLVEAGFRSVVGELDFDLPLRPGPVDPQIREAGPRDIGTVREIAATALVQSRFTQPWYSPDERRRLYAEWATNAVRGAYDDTCLMLADRGLLSLRLTGDGARIGLLAVAPVHQRQGVGAALLAAASGWSVQRGLSRLRVATQDGNLGAVALYQAHQAQVRAHSHWLYR